MTGAWRSKKDWPGKAHFVLENGTTACAGDRGPWGAKMGQLFKCEWKDLNPDDHLCGLCRKVVDTVCACLRCRVKAATPIRSAGEGEKR